MKQTQLTPEKGDHSSRDNIVDLLKGLAILLVVLGHIKAYPGVTNFIYTFHMPLLVFLSGCTFWYSYGKKGYRGSVKSNGVYVLHRFFSLILPDITWTILMFLLVDRDVSEDAVTGLGSYWFLATLFGIIFIISTVEYFTAHLVKAGGGELFSMEGMLM